MHEVYMNFLKVQTFRVGVLMLDYKNAEFYVYRIFSVAEPTFTLSPHLLTLT